MGVSDNMLHKEISKLASGGNSEGRLGRVATENGHVAPAPMFKQRKVSAVRDFPPGCGRLAALITKPCEQAGQAVSDSEKPALLSDYADKVQCEKPAVLPDNAEKVQCETEFSGGSEVATCLINEVSGSETNLPEENTAISDEEVPQRGVNLHLGESSLEKTSARNYRPRQGVTVVRDFPPFCGRNAPPLSEEERAKWLTSLKNKGINIEKFVNKEKSLVKTLCTDVRQVTEDVKVEGSAPRLFVEGIHFKPEEPVSDKMEKKGSYEAYSCNDMEEDAGNMSKNSIKPSCEAFPNEFDWNSVEGIRSKPEEPASEKMEKQGSYEAYSCNDMEEDPGNMSKNSITPSCEAFPNEFDRNSVEGIHSKPEEPASEKMEKQGAYEAYSCNNMESKNSIKPSCEAFPNEFDRISEKLTETGDVYATGLEENPILDIVVYEGGNSFEKKLPDSSSFEDQLLEDGHIVIYKEENSLEEKLPDSSSFEDQLLEGKPRSQEILSNVPCRQGKVTCKPDLAGGSLKRKKESNSLLPPPQANTKKSSSKKRARKSRGQVIVWNKEDSLQQDEQSTNDNFAAQRSCSYDVSLPPCPNSTDHNNDAMTTRNKVRETLRLFQAIFRKLLQEEESKMKEQGKASKRIDILAAKILKEKGKYVNTGKQIIGTVPGVEVGDEFQYFVELNIVGLHRQSQGGIDYLKRGEKIIATSIIAAGGYENDLDSSDVLSYMGQGGNVMQKGKQPEDQKLERGNLALANSKVIKNPVRVIRGETRSSSTLLESRGKTYVYDGLYLVEEFKQEPGPHGKLVFKYKLVRIPGQPELAWKVVKKSKAREGICVNDISQRKEKTPICAINTIAGETPPSFVYEPHMIYPDWCRPIPPKGCGCINGCSESGNCSCVMKNGGEIPYNHNGAIVEAKPLVYECGPNCSCPASCHNRVSQHGIKFQLEIFKTESRGWGVRSPNSIPSGSFICEYAGELLEDREAEERKGSDEYLFDIGNNNDSSLWDGLSTIMPDALSSSCQVVQDSGFTIDAARYGNIGRFINHSCSPNLYAQNVLYDHEDMRIPHIMFFAAENIPPLQELTYHYNYMIDQVRDENGNIKQKMLLWFF
ncbi:Histone-lysine N-methyltransferase, H3 lysine-9 specific SUVH6 [Hibiscus syriacus]|uniref:Histone-lysine N-methyltransferase, H3 lysine-9 specific SUVH6 n=1 Tax=Hibiscus syriacus TaxID=106335 RepID=A0A6A2YL13_HIBSY|nr:Histone-lysine N-methyltransferase, H3 lysine-9 specific SUVH6 [Hibiscus syriacus]